MNYPVEDPLKSVTNLILLLANQQKLLTSMSKNFLDLALPLSSLGDTTVLSMFKEHEKLLNAYFKNT